MLIFHLQVLEFLVREASYMATLCASMKKDLGYLSRRWSMGDQPIKAISLISTVKKLHSAWTHLTLRKIYQVGRINRHRSIRSAELMGTSRNGSQTEKYKLVSSRMTNLMHFPVTVFKMMAPIFSIM